MLKNHEKTFSFLQRSADFILVIICWLGSYYLRFKSGIVSAQPGLEETFINMSPVLASITLYFFQKENLYKSKRFTSRYKEIAAVLKANTGAFLTFIIFLYFLGSPQRLSRFTLLNYFLISSVFLVTLRISIRNFLRSLRRKGKNLRFIVLIGNGNQLGNYVNTLKKFKDAGIKILGWSNSEGLAEKFKIKSLTGSIPELREKYNPDAMIIGYKGKDTEELESLLKNSHTFLTPIQILPDLTYNFIGSTIDDFAGIPIINFNSPKLSTTDIFFKRLLDIIGSIFAIAIFSPIMLIIAIAVKFTSKGPIFYGQERVSLDGSNFKMWKFRSMRTDAENNSGAVWAKKDDDRKTPIGAFLRKTSLDELPQFFNVLLGNMSLVGPRPERPVFVQKFKDEIPAYMLRHKVKAGITGWAQVNGWRGDTSLEKRIECDIYYIKNWSLLFDIKILFMTLYSGFVNKNAY